MPKKESNLDPETEQLKAIAKALKEMIATDGWKIARDRLSEKVLALQNAFNINNQDPTKMLIDLESRKIASALLFDWLKDIEGTVDQTDINLPKEKRSYIIREG